MCKFHETKFVVSLPFWHQNWSQAVIVQWQQPTSHPDHAVTVHIQRAIVHISLSDTCS